jgi:hypothetical protein
VKTKSRYEVKEEEQFRSNGEMLKEDEVKIKRQTKLVPDW